MYGSGKWVIIRTDHRTDRQAVIREYHDRRQAERTAEALNRVKPHPCYLYTVIEAVPDPLAVLRRRVTT